MNETRQPLIALSPVTINQCTFEDAFIIASRAGFRGIGLRFDSLETFLERGGSITDVKMLAESNDLIFTEGAFLAEWQFHGGVPLIGRRVRQGTADENDENTLRRLKRIFEICDYLDCRNVTAAPSLTKIGSIDQAAEDFGRLCDLAYPYGIKICLEFMGAAPQINTIDAAYDIIIRANRPNGGLLVDTFLFHQGESSLESLQKTPVEKIFNVQLADAKPKPHRELDMLSDRLFPGEGIAPVGRIISILVEKGYDGPWTIELFNPDYETMEPFEVAKKSMSATRSLFDSAEVNR